MTKPSTPSCRASVYLLAAELALTGRSVGCHAISLASDEGYGRGAHFKAYRRYFDPEKVYWDGGWFGNPHIAENQEARVLALCFMAAIAERP